MPFTVQGLGQPREVPAGVVDGHYFEVMGLRPILGRLLGPADDGPNAPGAVVLTYKFWTQSLNADPTVIGRALRLDSIEGSRSATIVGVLEPSVPYPVATEIIANLVTSPHHLSATMVTFREHRMTEVFGRLAPGATLEQARAELRAVHAAMLAANPEVYRKEHQYTIAVRRMRDEINSRASAILWVLFGASVLLFVIASSNVANLVLARTVRRESELAVRSALGASAADLRRSLLAESLLLCGSGVAAALLVAAPVVQVLGRYAARFSVRADDLCLDATLVWFGIGLALVAAVFLAYVPRLPSAQAPASGLAAGGTRSATRSSRRLRTFAVTQITASFLLLAGAGLLLRTLYDLVSQPPPFDTARVLAINLPPVVNGRTPQQQRDLGREIVRRVAAVPGVAQVATGFSVPWRDTQGLGISFTFAVEGAVRADGAEDPRANFRSISPGFFATLGVPLIEGRDFDERDTNGADRVVVISKSVADRLFPGQSAIGRTLRWTDSVLEFVGISYDARRIVGVVPDYDDANIIPDPAMTIYQPVDQEGWGGRLFVRTDGDAGALVPEVTRAIRAIAPDQPVERAATLEDIRAAVLSPDTVNALVFGGFATVALLISVVGVAGVLGFSVSGRTREFGVRMALGARPGQILAGVLREGLGIAAAGVVAGVVAGLAGTRALSAWVGHVDLPGTLGLLGAAAVILAAAAVASAVPASRAARVNAVEALRAE
jgi:predicted permease